MTDKEFKRLTRPQLIDIIYQLQLKQEELTADNEKLTKALGDKHMCIGNAGNIANAALEIQNMMQSVLNTSAQYLEEIRTLRDETREECERILQQARHEAENIVAQAQTPHPVEHQAVDGPEFTIENRNNQQVNSNEQRIGEYNCTSDPGSGRIRKKALPLAKSLLQIFAWNNYYFIL